MPIWERDRYTKNRWVYRVFWNQEEQLWIHNRIQKRGTILPVISALQIWLRDRERKHQPIMICNLSHRKRTITVVVLIKTAANFDLFVSFFVVKILWRCFDSLCKSVHFFDSKAVPHHSHRTSFIQTLTLERRGCIQKSIILRGSCTLCFQGQITIILSLDLPLW